MTDLAYPELEPASTADCSQKRSRSVVYVETRQPRATYVVPLDNVALGVDQQSAEALTSSGATRELLRRRRQDPPRQPARRAPGPCASRAVSINARGLATA
jgi:hypothetical protein